MSRQRIDRCLAAVVLAGGLFATPLSAAPATPDVGPDLTAMLFPEPPELKPAVDFWVRVFTEVSQNQILLHDRVHPQLVYGVLDFTVPAQVMEPRDLRRHMREREKAEKERIADLLTYLARRDSGTPLSPAARELAALFEGIEEPDKFLAAAGRIRGQRGLAERFRDAIIISGAYLPGMEAIFAARGLPVELTRLPLVESSFNLRAYSSSGAAGVWQFMPSTARIYMRLDEIRDDRRDPWFSTHAAAAHLADDYTRLGQWPLAVTAYNYGRNGVARALEAVNGSSLVDLIQRFDGSRWGFAAQNFYAEFLAALKVEQNAVRYFGPTDRAEPEEYEWVEVGDYVRFDTLAGLAGLEPAQLARLNPAYSSAVVKGHLYVPPGEKLRLPTGRALPFELAYAQLPASYRHDRQREYFVHHRVRPGETLSGIAERYRSSAKEIAKLNALGSRHFIRSGQQLKIPTGGGGHEVVTAHKVQSGESLIRIARRYGVGVDELMKLNRIEKPERLRAGAVLKLPGQAAESFVHHRIQSGQTVEGLARRYGVTVNAIKELNGLKDIDRIRIGQQLRIPAGSS